MRIIDHGNYFLITIPFDRWFKVNLQAVKKLDVYMHNYGGVVVEEKHGKVKWLADKQVWYVAGDLRKELLEMANKHKARIEPYETAAPEKVGDVDPLPELSLTLPLKDVTLRHYQEQGIAQGMNLRRFLNGDEPGLGKTLQSISTLVGWKMSGHDVFPCLVIAPATLKENWKREIEKFTSLKAAILTDRIKNTWPQYHKAGMVQVFIVNYESLKKYFVANINTIKGAKLSKDIDMRDTVSLIKSVIIDESHKVKDPSTMQAKLCARITHGKEFRILLSGTPVMNKPSDLYAQLGIMGQLQYFGGTKKAFVDRYCAGGKGASNLRELNYLLNKHCFFRREKKDVAKDLPDKRRQQIVCDITTREEYDLAEQNFELFLRRAGATSGAIDKAMRAEALVKINELKQISAKGKIKEAQEFIDEVLESGQKLVVFCNLKAIVKSVKEIYPNAVTITGDDSMEQRQIHIDRFQNDPSCNLIVCNFKAAGVGVTLTASSEVLFIEYPWTYADTVQAEDRTHRIGQKNVVRSTFLLGKNTIDERMLDMILEKKDIANTITGGTDDMEMATVDKVITLFTTKANVA